MITLGHPVAYYDGIASCQDVTTCLGTPIESFTLSATSLPSKFSSYKYYEMGFQGTYSVSGMGVWTDTHSAITGAGSFDGTLYLDYSPEGDMVIVEGYAATVCPSSTETECSTSELKGSFSLRAWELGIVGDETIMRTAPKLTKLDYVSTWQCKSASLEYHFDVSHCTDSNAPKVHWLGLWSQYTDDNEKYYNPDCFVVGGNDQKSNVLKIVPNGYDTEIHATVEIDPANPAGALITYEMYGAGCGTRGPCNGPGMFVNCERAVNHGSSTPWVDIGVAEIEQTVWLSDKMG